MSAAATTLRPHRQGRPSDTIYGVIGAVDHQGRSLTWSDGFWGGHPWLVADAEALARSGKLLVVPGAFGRQVPAGDADPVAVMAIMLEVTGSLYNFTGDVPAAAIVALIKSPVAPASKELS